MPDCRYSIIFRGAVAVSMDIRMLDIDQCPGKYHTPNAFKDTHKCDDKSSYVSIKEDRWISHVRIIQNIIYTISCILLLDFAILGRYTLIIFSVCLFWEEASPLEATNVSANRGMNIRLKIRSLIMMDSW